MYTPPLPKLEAAQMVCLHSFSLFTYTHSHTLLEDGQGLLLFGKQERQTLAHPQNGAGFTGTDLMLFLFHSSYAIKKSIINAVAI